MKQEKHSGRMIAKIAALIKLVEILQWILSLIGVIALGANLIFGGRINADILGIHGSMISHGYTLNLVSEDGVVNMGALNFVIFVAILTCSLTAVIYHNIYLVLQSARRKEDPEETITPFTDLNVKRIKRIGCLCILIPGLEYVLGVIASWMIGKSVIEANLNATGFIMGLVIFSIAYVFEYGVRLQKDVDSFI